MKYLKKYERQENLMRYFVDYVMLSTNKGVHPLFPEVKQPQKNRGIIHIHIAAYKAILLNCIQTEIKKILQKKIFMVFREIDPQLHRFYHWII